MILSRRSLLGLLPGLPFLASVLDEPTPVIVPAGEYRVILNVRTLDPEALTLKVREALRQVRAS